MNLGVSRRHEAKGVKIPLFTEGEGNVYEKQTLTDGSWTVVGGLEIQTKSRLPCIDVFA